MINITSNQHISEHDEYIISDIYYPHFLTSSGHPSSEDFVPPYLYHLYNTCSFFKNNYKSASDMLYYRNGDADGNIIDYSTYSYDNLFFYNTIEKKLEVLGGGEIYSHFMELKSTNLWYYKNSSSYGFIHSINGSTGEILDDNRYLIDNVMPLYLLLENYVSSSYSEIIKFYNLINGIEFWDSVNKGYYTSNSSTSAYKLADVNLYAILANMLIARSPDFHDTEIQNGALNYANQTLEKLMVSLWDSDNKGFKIEATSNWGPVGGESLKKRLDINALGIMAFLEFYLYTNDTTYLDHAILVFEKMENGLWNDASDLYYYSTESVDWQIPINQPNTHTLLKENAIMMAACLQMFEATGNMTYYDRAFELYESFETSFYDDTTEAYDYRFSPVADNYKNLNSNMYLIDSYLKATEIYNAPLLVASYNTTEIVPDYIFNQDSLNITTSMVYQSKMMNITYISDVNVTYLFYDHNDTFFYEENGYIESGNSNDTLIYSITDALPYGDGYEVRIWTNSSKFCISTTIMTFNVISGLVNKPIEGLGTTLYQGPTLNITIPVNNTRDGNVTLDVSMEGDNIINQYLSDVEFFSYLYHNDTFVSLNLTTITDARLGLDYISFKFYSGSVIYLEINVSITIGDSFDYTALIYANKVVDQDLILVKFNLINFLPDDTQSINVSFSGAALLNNTGEGLFRDEITLAAKESRPLIYYFNISGSGNVSINMTLSKNSTIYYTESLPIQIMSPLVPVRTSYPTTVTQWDYAHLIMIVDNNGRQAERYTLIVIEQNPLFGIPNSIVIRNEFAPGRNRIEARIFSTLNPYEFSVKTFYYELRDSNNELIDSGIFQFGIELSIAALFFCYIIPFAIPIIIILLYKNKELKNKQLRRR